MSQGPSSMLTSLDEHARSEYWATLALRHCPGFGARVLCRLLRELGTAYAVFRRAKEGSLKGFGLTDSALSALRAETWRGAALVEWNTAGRCAGEIVLWTDERYPSLLREIPDAPALLYARGDVELLRNPAVGVVGTRNCTQQGRRAAAALAGSLAASGITIVSGMARGVDTAAHNAALELPGGTIAVLGTGIDVAYPSENRALYHRIADNGLILSEFSPGTPPEARHFPIRNRIISGLSLGVLVIEAAPGSGSLITARNALEQNRAVYAVGGGIGEAQSLGCQELIRQGALPVFSHEDILRDLQALLIEHCDSPLQLTFFSKMPREAAPDPAVSVGQPRKTAAGGAPEPQSPPSSATAAPVLREHVPETPAGRIMVALARRKAASADELGEELNMGPGEVNAALVMLEVDGKLRRRADGRYALM